MKLVGVAFFIALIFLTNLNLWTIAELVNRYRAEVNATKYFSRIAQYCGNTGNCNRTLCNDKQTVVPPECMEHIEEMECFRTCKDPKILTDCLEEHSGNIAYCSIIFKRYIMSATETTKDHHVGKAEYTAWPCSIKCRTDPKFWSCVHRCDDRGCFNAFHNCETMPRNGTFDPRPWCDTSDPLYLTRMECRDCYVYNLTSELRQTNKECSVRFSYISSESHPEEEEEESNSTTGGQRNNTSEETTNTNETGKGDPIRFNAVQPRCIFHKDIEEGKEPKVNETFPFFLVTECLRRKGIVFPDDPLYKPPNATATNATILEDDDDGNYTTTESVIAGNSTTESSHRTIIRKIDPAKIPRYYLENCVKRELAAKQIEWCTGKTFYSQCEQNQLGPKCQKHCMQHLTKPYCYLPCSRHPRMFACEADCQRKYPRISCECSEKEDTTLGVKARTKFFTESWLRMEKYRRRLNSNCSLPTNGCFRDLLHEPKPNPEEDIYTPLAVEDVWEIEATKERNCKSLRHVRLFGAKLAQSLNKEWAISEDMMNLAQYYTVSECQELCQEAAEGIATYCLRECLKKVRTNEEMNRVCQSNWTRGKHELPESQIPTYLRSEITLYCLLTSKELANTNWTLEEYQNLFEPTHLRALQICEKRRRNESELAIREQFELFAHITYEIENEWCSECIRTSATAPHWYDIEHTECEHDECHGGRGREEMFCGPLKSTKTQTKLISSTDECTWQIDYSFSREPYKLWATYFDEISPHDETAHLTAPKTVGYLQKSRVTSGVGHYVFPYFLIVRPVCDGRFYDEKVYKFIASGAVPVVKITYLPHSSRARYVNLMYSLFQGSLINLERTSDVEKRYIPQNPLNRLVGNETEYDGTSGCHLGVCYPAFAIPQVLLHIPILDITVQNQQEFLQTKVLTYVNTMHVRDVPGAGKLRVENKTDPPSPAQFFPKQKTETYEDVQFVDLWARLPDSMEAAGDGFPGPELSHLEDENCVPYPSEEDSEVGGNPFAPLDSEDFFRMQYTHGNAPQVMIAGFYDPNLVIIGDPDMNKFELARWGFEATGGTESKPTPRLFQGKFPCLSHHYHVQGFTKPMYSNYERLDSSYWLQYYRTRYIPKDYVASESKAIFEALALEDRILLLTSRGLVSFYQNYNLTALLGKPWEVEGQDRIDSCLKILRIARRSHPVTDTIVGISYDYQINEGDNSTRDASQEVWIGTYTGVGKPISWKKINSGLSSQNLKEERVYNVGGDNLGDVELLPEKKLIDIPVERRETSPRSQIEAICYIVYRSKMGKASYIELIEDQGWCEAVDATPVVAVESKIQVLVRMRAYYTGGMKVGNYAGNDKDPRRVVYFYVVASFNNDPGTSLFNTWQIDAIIPRIPCLDEHDQSIPNVVQFNMDYFRKGDPELIGQNFGCSEKPENKKAENQIFLHGMTYTRSYNLHMFLYGNKLLQSTDGGQTFVHLKSFPESDDPAYQANCVGKNSEGELSSDQKSRMAYHRIKLMAFDDIGHYAFLTSKRELWYGNLGTLHQIRLRPSPAHSMVLTNLYEVKEILEAVPFTVFFDSNNVLVEMVAVVDANGTVSRIAKRPMATTGILRARHFIQQFEKEGQLRFNKLEGIVKDVNSGNIEKSNVIGPELTKEIIYDPLKWSVFCPYASPAFSHNFSERHARAQSYFFPPPRQHPDLGNVKIRTTLMTYQAVAFHLVWNSFFTDEYRSYSYLNVDPFKSWKKKKANEAIIGRLTYLNLDAKDHGVLVLPDKYRRYFTINADSKRIFALYYMDYGTVVQMKLEYSISNDYTTNPIDYVKHQLSAIQLNVDNSNGTLIQVNTEKEVIAPRAAVKYVIHMSVKKNTGLQQEYPGRNALVIPIYFHLIGAFGNCIGTRSTGILGDSIATAIAVGCPPSTDLVFDWNSTVHSIKFRDVEAHYGAAPSECFEGEPFCFFARYPLVFHFHIFDHSKQKHHKFSGKYIMRIVGGGYTKENMKDYTIEEQQAFNVPAVSDISLIWNEWDRKLHQKKEHKDDTVKAGRNDSREIILEAGVSTIKWACHTLSPCARISPKANFESVYYFKIFVTNRGVDNDTLCLFEKEFIILLYGFPPSPELQLVTTVLFYIFVVTLLYLVYVFFRNKKKLWRSTLLKLQGWIQIVKDTFPNSWGKEDLDDGETTAERQKRHDEILMSLQGHLNVPNLVQKHTEDPDSREKGQQEVKSLDSRTSLQRSYHSHSSASSFKSGSSGASGSTSPMLNPVTGRAGPSTWSDLIYEQIIAKRLAAIVETNRKDADDLKKKAELKKQEDQMEKEVKEAREREARKD